MGANITIFDALGQLRSVAADDIGEVHYQKNKIVWGSDGLDIPVDILSPLPVQITARPSAGGSNSHHTIALAATPVAVTPNPGNLFSLDVDNPDGTDEAYLHIYDSSSVIVGTTPPSFTFRVLPNEHRSRNFVVGVAFLSAIRVAATRQSTGIVAPTTPLIVNMEYV